MNNSIKYNYELGGFIARFAAMLIDNFIALILIIPFYGLTTIYISLKWYFVILLFSFAAWASVVVLYHVLLESSSKGATLGKQLMGIKVIKDNGEKLSFGTAFLRTFIKFAMDFSCFAPLPWIVIFLTDKRKTIHDLVANTIVIKKPAVIYGESMEPVIEVCGGCKSVFTPTESDFENGRYKCPVCGKENRLWKRR